MSQHFTRNTVSVAFWCGRCKKETQHRIDDRRKGSCIECMERLEKEHDSKAQEQPPATQQNLF